MGLCQSQWPDPILVFGEPVELLAQGWDISSTNEQLAVWLPQAGGLGPGPGCAFLGHLPVVWPREAKHWTALSLVFCCPS